MRISSAYPDPFIGCTMFPENAEADEPGFGSDVAAPPKPNNPAGVGSGLDAPPPPPLDPNNPADSLKVRSGL